MDRQSRIVLPAGVQWVKLLGQGSFATTTGTYYSRMFIMQDDVAKAIGSRQDPPNNFTHHFQSISPVLPVSGGESFSMKVEQSGTSDALDFNGASSDFITFSIEEVR